MFAYVGSRTSARGTGINVYRVNAPGNWAHVATVDDLVNPSFLLVSPDRRFLYCVHGGGSEASAFAIDPGSGMLAFINRCSTEGRNPVHLAIDPSGRFMVVVNYATSSLAVLPIGPDGALSQVIQVLPLEGGPGPHPVEQTHPHPHHVRFDPAGRFVFVPDKGADCVHCLALDAGGTLAPIDPPKVHSRPGAGPRHIDFHPGSRFAYAVNELDSTVTAYAYDAARGSLEPLQVRSALPPDFAGENTGAEIAVTPTGAFLHCSNRGHDSIATFAIGPDGRLADPTWTAAMGRGPRFFTLDPRAECLYVANEITDDIAAFRLGADGGSPVPIGLAAKTGSPVCIDFFRSPPGGQELIQ